MVSLEDKKEAKSLGNAEEFEPVGDELNQYFEELDVGSDLSDIEEFDDVLEKGPIEFIRSSNSSDDYKNSHNNDHHNTVESKQTSANIKAATATELDTNKSKKSPGKDAGQKDNRKKKMWGYILLGAILSALPVLLFLKLYARFPDSFYYWFPWNKYSPSSKPHHIFFVELYNTYGVYLFLILQFCVTFAISLFFGYGSDSRNLLLYVLIVLASSVVIFIVNTIVYLITGILCGILPLFILIYGLGAITATGGSVLYIFGSIVGGIAEIRISN